MRKKYLIIAVVAILLCASLMLVACGNNGGKGFEEVVQVSDYDNCFVAKSKTAYNVFDEKGKKIFKKDFDEISIGKQGLVTAKNNGDTSYRYFNLKGKEYNFAVDGLAIKSVTVNESTNREYVAGELKTRTFDNAIIQVLYNDANTNSTFYSLFNIGGEKVASNTDSLHSVSDTVSITSSVRVGRRTIEKYSVENTYVRNEKIAYYCIQEDTVQETTTNKSSSIQILNTELNSIFTEKSSNYTVISSDENNASEYIVLKHYSNSNQYDVLVNFNNGKAINFSNLGVAPLNRQVDYQDDYVTVTEGNPIISSKVQLYSVGNDNMVEIVGKDVVDLGNNLAVLSDNSSSPTGLTFKFYNKKTMQIARNSANSLKITSDTILIDGQFVDKDLKPYLNGVASADNYQFVFSDTAKDRLYYLVENANGTIDYYMNSQILKRFDANEIFYSFSAQYSGRYFKMKNTSTDKVTTYLTVDPMITLEDCSIEDSIEYSILCEKNASGKVSKVHVYIMGDLYSYVMPLNLSGVSASVDSNQNGFVVTITYRDEIGDAYAENYVYYCENTTTQKCTLLLSNKTLHTSNTSTTVEDYDDKIMVVEKRFDGKINAGSYKYVNTIYDLVSKDKETTQAVELSKWDTYGSGITLNGDYAIEDSSHGGSHFSNVYSIRTGKKIVNSNYLIKKINGNLAIFTNNETTYGVMRLSEDGYKILDDAKYVECDLISDEYYVLVTYDKNLAPLATLKNIKGKTIIKNAYAIEFNKNLLSTDCSVVDGKFCLNVSYQTKAGGTFKYKSLGRVIGFEND